jgi:hypothetical protein
MAHGLFAFQTIDLLAPCFSQSFINTRINPGAIYFPTVVERLLLPWPVAIRI